MARHETHRWRLTGALAAACAGFAWAGAEAQPPTVAPDQPRIVSVQAADEPAPLKGQVTCALELDTTPACMAARMITTLNRLCIITPLPVF